MGGSSIRIQGSSATDAEEFDTDIEELPLQWIQGSFLVAWTRVSKQPVQKVGWAVFLFVSLKGLFDSEFFVFFFQR